MIYSINTESMPDPIKLGRIRYIGGWNHRYNHRLNVIIYVMNGKLVFDFEDGVKVTVENGMCILIPAGRKYTVTTVEESEISYAHFRLNQEITVITENEAKEYLRSCREKQNDALREDYRGSYDFKLIVNETTVLDGSEEKMRFGFSRCIEFRYGNDALDRMRLVNRFMNILLILASRTEEQYVKTDMLSATMEKIVAYIERNYTSPITLEMISEEFGISKQYVMRLFKKQTGMTVTHYINMIKLRRSLDLLNFSSLTVSEVAYSLGYSSSYYYCRLFKEYYGITPTEYQKTRDETKI